jgi:hypothetical protein
MIVLVVLLLILAAFGWLGFNIWLRAGSKRMPRGGGQL